MSRIAQIRKQRNMTQADLAEILETTAVSVGRYEREDQRLTLPLLRQIANALQCSIADLVGEDAASEAGSIMIPEYDVRVSAGDGFHVDTETQRDHWPFSRSYIEGELRLSPGQLVVLEAIGDSMAPTILSGDRILVNMGDRRVSQPGIFCLWDGDGTVIKRIETIPGSQPAMLRRISDNPLHGDYEVLAEETQIIGRVVWYARRI